MELDKVFQQVFPTKDDYLAFAPSLSFLRRIELVFASMISYDPPVFSTPIRPDPAARFDPAEMNQEQLVGEIMEIGCYRKQPQATRYFAQSRLQDDTVVAACRRIAKWLRTRPSTIPIRPAQLDFTIRNDVVCRSLITSHVYLQQILQVEGRYMDFAQQLLVAERQEIVLWAKAKYESWENK